MRSEIIKKIQRNNNYILEIKDDLQSKKRISVKDILTAADTIKTIKNMNFAYKQLLENQNLKL